MGGRFVNEGGAGALHWLREGGVRCTKLNSGAYQLEESEEVTMLVGVGPPGEARAQQGGQLQE